MSLQYTLRSAPRDIVFVHGAGGTKLLWRRILEGLEGGARALAVNLPGHPSGEIPCRSIDEYAEAVRRFI
ncbi:MAG TPA: alpha/beta fold hydrolase [Nitrososphaerales archaeon]|nr:alpha/beta fold hydrolase [Nitrososphaerales archaeon]